MESESGIRLQNDLQFVFFLVRKNKFSLLYSTGSSQKFIDRIIHDDIKNKQTEKK